MRSSFHILFSLFVFAINVCDAQQVVRTGDMVFPRFFHATALLKDGRVLAVGGFAGDGGETKSAEVYDPANGTWRRVGDTVAELIFPLAVSLHDGRVLIVRGRSLELFDPTTEKFSTVGSVPGSIGAALLLPDGRVFLAGEPENNSALYDPVTGVAATLETMEASVPIALPDGRLVMIGSSSAWIYEVKETSLKLLFRHDFGRTLYQTSAALLLDGNILIPGGSITPFNGPTSRTSVLYDPRRGTVRSTGNLPEAQNLYGITSLNDGSVLTTGGFELDWATSNYYYPPALYDPSSERFTSVRVPVIYAATQLQDGRVLLSGGQGPTAFLYSPPPRVISSASFASRVAPGSLATLFGVGLSTETAAAGHGALPVNLGGSSLAIVDSAGTTRLADLLYVSPLQINFVVPSDFQPGKLSLTVQRSDGVQIRANADANILAPALFAYPDSGPIAYGLRMEPNGSTTVLLPHQAIVLDERPVYLVLYATGIRNRLSLANAQVDIGGVTVPVEYAGPEGSGTPGLDQVSVRLTSDLKGVGVANLVLTVDGIPSNTVSVEIR